MTLLLLTRSTSYFYPRSPCGERLMYALIFTGSVLFLSTLSLRRATVMDTLILADALRSLSTLSLRRATTKSDQGANSRKISIHALLAESDTRAKSHDPGQILFLSTLSLRRATQGADPCGQKRGISIHALLAESDSKSAQNSGALLRI